jgi:K(+)-stimulated pyrophosphate-energized sodium pump
VSTGAYRAVEFISTHIRLDEVVKASQKDSKKVVEICTIYAQKGMFNIFLAVFFGTLACAFHRTVLLHRLPDFAGDHRAVPGGVHGQRRRRLGQRQEDRRNRNARQGHRPAQRSVVGDTVGDPFKDTASVAMNPIIKFTTLFGLLAVEMAVGLQAQGYSGAGLAAGCRVPGRQPGVRVPQFLRHAHRRQDR